MRQKNKNNRHHKAKGEKDEAKGKKNNTSQGKRRKRQGKKRKKTSKKRQGKKTLKKRMMIDYLICVVLLGILLFVHHRYMMRKHRERMERDGDYDDGDVMYSMFRKYLLSESSDGELDASAKPILWIHVPYEYNSREWLDFGSRSSFNLNQPYLYLTTKSIIRHCNKDFKIVIIDDASFKKLLPSWQVDLASLADPVKTHMRKLALASTLEKYGGFTVPISFLCFKNLLPLYRQGIENTGVFVCEQATYGQNLSSEFGEQDSYQPSFTEFMGCVKGNEMAKKCVEFLYRQNSSDYTAQIDFLGTFHQWMARQVDRGRVTLIPGTLVGTRQTNDTRDPVIVDELLGSEQYLDIPLAKVYGIWIPARQILRRNAYQWFASLSSEEIVNGNFLLAKYFVHALAPNYEITEAMVADIHLADLPSENQTLHLTKDQAKDWIGFWRVPTSDTLNIWGMKPQWLGTNIPKAKNTGNLY